MSDLDSSSPVPIEPLPSDLSNLIERARLRTPARLWVGRAGLAYRTATQLELRQDHAAAIDAVHAEVSLKRDFPAEFIEHYRLFEVDTNATSKADYLMRPDQGRHFPDSARTAIVDGCPIKVDLQVVLGDGLSAAALATQAPALLPLLEQGARERGWSFGRPLLVRFCRVGILNEIGELLDPAVVVLLIGERPGLATAESLSAYMASRPRPGHTDAQRNVISNIHARGLPPALAAPRILALAEQIRQLQSSGSQVKESLPHHPTSAFLSTPEAP